MPTSTILEKIIINSSVRSFPIAYIVPSYIEDLDADYLINVLEKPENSELLKIIGDSSINNNSLEWKSLWSTLEKNPEILKMKEKYKEKWDKIISFRWSRTKANSLENIQGGSSSLTNQYDQQAQRLNDQNPPGTIPSFQEWMLSRGTVQAKTFGQSSIKPIKNV